MPSSSLTSDAVIANKLFTADAWLVGTRLLHDRTLDHNGTQSTETVVLSSAIGPYPTGSTVQTVLADFALRLSVLEGSNHVFANFIASAFILPHFYADAVMLRIESASMTADAVINLAGPHSFTVDALIFRPGTTSPTSFTANAFLV